ncbi:MAG TPA: hypothetical protein VF752_09495 [Thermoleophilaceae bacterium]
MDNVTTGKPDAKPDDSAHTPGVKEGNDPGGYRKMRGHLDDDRSTAKRSTGINPDMEEPIDPRMPNLSPG